MRIMINTNVLISAILFPKSQLTRVIARGMFIT
ncbi:hypothetical protein DesyoDRAFT_4085 [Desulfosporosinus youngiae DSM 17734]|uniref:Toxin-antitoxin system toxin component, PIN family n=1 Tax=Desulfosporosinus youngiae DSM 17734 TaxID=768710 RepID=H5Y641_9FIRM|nr:hypothetical protein DesyoDRAFT_4085 [Desulfosporosinus youngiae DSM 17734]